MDLLEETLHSYEVKFDQKLTKPEVRKYILHLCAYIITEYNCTWDDMRGVVRFIVVINRTFRHNQWEISEGLDTFNNNPSVIATLYLFFHETIEWYREVSVKDNYLILEHMSLGLYMTLSLEGECTQYPACFFLHKTSMTKVYALMTYAIDVLNRTMFIKKYHEYNMNYQPLTEKLLTYDIPDSSQQGLC